MCLSLGARTTCYCSVVVLIVVVVVVVVVSVIIVAGDACLSWLARVRVPLCWLLIRLVLSVFLVLPCCGC